MKLNGINMKQTAVEWLVNIVQSCIAPDYIPVEIIKQAKEMEKQQIIDAYENGQLKEAKKEFWTLGSLYYNKTFKSE